MLGSPYRYRSPTKSAQAYAGNAIVGGMAGMASPDVSIGSPGGGFHFDMASLEKEAELLKNSSNSGGGEGEDGNGEKKKPPPTVWAGYGPAELVGSSRGGPSQGQHHLPPPPPPPPPSSSHAHYRYHNGYVYHGGPPQPPPGQKRAQAQGAGEGKERNSSKVSPFRSI